MTARAESVILRDLAAALDRLEKAGCYRRYGSGGMGKIDVGFAFQPGSEGFAILMERVKPAVLARWDELRDEAMRAMEMDVVLLRAELVTVQAEIA